MIPEIGHFALIVALCMATVQGTLPIIGAAKGIPHWMALARPAAQGQFVLVALAFAALTYAFVTNDFSVQYVAMHSNSQLPLMYRIGAVWGGHEGSLLLWILILTVWMVAVSVFSRHLPEEMIARVLGVMGLIAVGFLAFILFTSNPFTRLLPAAADGEDLNPLLQDPGLVVHPPMLYMGYVGFSVAFAFAISALLSGKLDATWARWSRPWTLVAWMFLTLGITMGSAWSYYVLGWGGWWFWDPVENASFMPWLVGTALIHSLAVTEKRASFKSWTVLMAIFAFSLSLLGTFLVRSGVLTSVHSFASDPQRGVFILGFLTTVVGLSLALYAWRAPKIGLGGTFALISRESMLLANNVLFVVAAGAVLLGTLAPLLVDALAAMAVIPKASKISVGPPYFNLVFVPIMTMVVFLMGIGPVAKWKKANLPELGARVRWAALSAGMVAVLLPFILGRWSWLVSLGLLMAIWIIITVALQLGGRLRKLRSEYGLLGRLIALPRGFLGMQLAHLGVAVFILGVTVVGGYESSKEVRMEVGDTVEVAGFTFRFDGAQEEPGPNYEATRGVFSVFRHGVPVVQLYPEKRVFNVTRQPTTEAAIDSNLLRHLFVTLGEPVGKGGWSVRVVYRPFINWIWLGCGMMALGGLLSLSDRRYRILARKRQAQPVPEALPHVVLSPTLSRAETQSQ